jgi:hypothetical protein
MKNLVSHINGLRFTAFGNSVLRIFEPKREEVIEGWRKRRNKEFHELCSSRNNIRMMIWTGYVALMGGIKYVRIVSRKT